jgi:regulator of protease activity HflC (stomatin/prohibitin superfamily)
MMRSFGAVLVALVVLFFLAVSSVVTVPAGHVGVVDLFGQVRPQPLPPGLHLINPFARVHKMSVKTQEMKETMETPSREGLVVTLEVSLIYNLRPESAVEVYRTVGRNYEGVIIEPMFRSIVREVTSSVKAEALYSPEREKLAQQMVDMLRRDVEPRGIRVQSAPLRSVRLPQLLQQAIQMKLQAEQESQQMEFVIQKARQEADRKAIEAKGIAAFQDIVARGISPQLLQWKGIEATEKLATSHNAKVIVIGNGKNQLPIILGADDGK